MAGEPATLGQRLRKQQQRHPPPLGQEARHVLKMNEGRPNIVDEIKNGEVQLIVNTPAGKLSVTDDSYIRKSAIKDGIAYVTTIPAAVAAAEGIAARLQGEAEVRSLQEYHADLAQAQAH